MDIIVSSKIEADSQLERIRRERGFEGHSQSNSTLVSLLDQTLNIISNELYQTPTHFLLELIQNADDNRYQNHVSPSLSLRLYERDGRQYFRTDCNEVGFTLSQIDAITGVGKSTKKVDGSSGQKGYIGEKGIGFKSVFKVADVAHVASGSYQFKFDRSQPIGMILPILSPFPFADLVPDHTQFLLEVKRKEDYLEIERELGGVKPELLIFLRKLTRLALFFPGNRGSSIFDRSLNISDQDFGDDVETITISAATAGVDATCTKQVQTAMQKKYIVYRHEVRGLRPEPKRKGISSSEVTLVFPVADCYTPIIEPQMTFAFLPIDDFGFKFLIHADFLLVASRESLEYRCRWNLELCRGIRDAFLAAIKRFASMPPRKIGSEQRRKGLCFTWPKYLGRTPRDNSFWDDLHASIMNHLRYTPILLPRNPQFSFRTPETLRYVPDKYRYGWGTLFDSLSNGYGDGHLAFEYDDVWYELSQLGVQLLSLDELCTEFEQWVAQVGAAGLQNQPLLWHEQISRLFCDSQFLRTRLRKLPIIPLRDGSWAKAESGRVFLDFNSEDNVPEGLDISIVDPTASQNRARRQFFKFLGIMEYTPLQVCNVIIKLHRDLDNRTEKKLISDAAYLFKHRALLGSYSTPPQLFFVITRDGKRMKSKLGPIYCDDSRVQPNLVNRYRSSSGNPFWILDDGYEAVICANEGDPIARAKRKNQFLDWLLLSDTFWNIPILVRNGRLTQEWAFLRDANVIDLLQVLRQRFSHPDFYVLPPVLVKAVPELQVPCRDGNLRRLGVLALPTEELIRECPHIEFVDLPGPHPIHSSWEFLSQFGVLCTCDTTARLRELQALRKRFRPDEVDKEAVHAIYRTLNLPVRLSTDHDKIR
ncbi:hypothetical protein N0V88_007268 [Collariella sp. IMI 366227]|nr:hypothetical protein N0V88_007268 [Collariella sp. IMI 366227]